MPSIRGRLSTATLRFGDIIASISKGEIKVPQFQRKFVWRDEQAIKLLDSIAFNYPIGSLLLWKTERKLSVERNIGDFFLPETDDKTPTDYILDGQQRITVIYSCLGASIDSPGFASVYDLMSESFIRQPANPQPTHCPLRCLFVTSQLLDFRQTLQALDDAQLLQSRLDELVDAFTNYQIPVVTLKDLDIEEVCPIFERINSSGTNLSMYDLLVAATWTADFSLDTETTKIADVLQLKGLFDVEPDAILKCFSVAHAGDVRKNTILSLRNLTLQQKQQMVTVTKSAAELATDFLVTHFRLKNWVFLPYEALFIILCRLFSQTQALDAQQVHRLEQWFWRASLSQRYRGGSDTFISDDIAKAVNFILLNEGQADQFGVAPNAAELIESNFRSNSSRTQAFILVLAASQPQNITNGATIDIREALSNYNKHQFHHIYPKAYLTRNGVSNRVNSLANICMLASSENNNISDDDPKIYIPRCYSDLGARAMEVFASNLLQTPEDFNYAVATYDEFLQNRAVILAERLAALCS